jgi:hypothetical protein
MLPALLTVWHRIHALLVDPAFDAAALLAIIGAEIHAIFHNRIQSREAKEQTREAKKQTSIANKTYELYRTYFDVTEKRKADAREAQRKSRAAKKERAAVESGPPTDEELSVVQGIVNEAEQPTPPEGEVPPPMALPDEEESEEAL